MGRSWHVTAHNLHPPVSVRATWGGGHNPSKLCHCPRLHEHRACASVGAPPPSGNREVTTDTELREPALAHGSHMWNHLPKNLKLLNLHLVSQPLAMHELRGTLPGTGRWGRGSALGLEGPQQGPRHAPGAAKAHVGSALLGSETPGRGGWLSLELGTLPSTRMAGLGEKPGKE